jgi:homogentisate 1,2-dioxygenase
MLARLAFGDLPKKPHTALRDGAGRLRYEECITRRGFDGPFTILYHEHRPHEAIPVGARAGWAPARRESPSPLRRHFRGGELVSSGGSVLHARSVLLENDDVALALVRPSTDDDAYFSNGDGDDLYFIHEGSGLLRSQFGDLRFGANDYLCVPRGLLHRFVLDTGVKQHFLVIECRGGLSLPKQYRNEVGQLRMDAPYSLRDFRVPAFAGPSDEGIRASVVQRQGSFYGFEQARSPLDVVGWDGAVYPWAFSILDFQARVGQVHLPPTMHATFELGGALLCSFVPRPLDFHPAAVSCPYPHSSVDIDEVIYYVSGTFTSRKGVGPASLSLHPAGIAHGPHPGAYEASVGATHTDELAVMLDCQRPLFATTLALSVEDASYQRSFVEPGSSQFTG